MVIPVYRKLKYSGGVVITRRLPAPGNLVVKEGDSVVPFTKVARSKISKESFDIGDDIKLRKDIEPGAFLYKGDKLGKSGLFKKVFAPYNGTVEQKGEKLVFSQEKRDVWTLSGVWGTVDKITQDQKILIKTQSVDVDFVAHTSNIVMGELIVFPNPSELLDMEYLEKFSSNTQNKVIYIGHNIRRPIVEKAAELGIGALIGGSIEKAAYNHAVRKKLPLGILTGFGKLDTPKFVFDFLKTISNRHVFVDGVRGLLQVPMPAENIYKREQPPGTLRQVESGLSVFILQKPFFGVTGTVESVQNDIIHVKLDKSGEIAKVKIPNLFALS